jgi:uncharacterized protein (DUF2147 family)
MSMRKSIFCFVTSSLFATASFASADNAIAAAEAAQKSASAVGYEWRDTGKLITEAKKLAQQGQTEEAVNIANIAQQQGVNAYAQYKSELKRYSQSQ